MIAGVIIFGLIFGSFLNVVIYRLPRGISLVRPGSHCPSCHAPIRFYDNIPVLSYLFLGGRCRRCKKTVSWRYPAVELLTAAVLALIFWRYGWSEEFIRYGVLSLFLVPISFIDWERGLIPNKLTVPGFILGLALAFAFQIENWASVLLLDLLAGALGGGTIVLLLGLLGRLLFRKESLGMGDVKLLVMIGIYVGFPGNVLSLFFGSIAAALYILVAALQRKLHFGKTIPFGPFIAFGTLVFVAAGTYIIRWYTGLL